MFDWVLNASLCSEYIINHFNQNYIPDKSDTENESYLSYRINLIM